MRGAMKFAIAAMLSMSIGVAKEPSRLRLTIQVETEEHCQFSPVAQGLILHLRLRFVNLGGSIEVQEVEEPSVILVSKGVGEMRREIYEFRSQPWEYFEPPPPLNKRAISVKQRGSFEIVQPIDFMVTKPGAERSSDQFVNVGSHYLQVRKAVNIGGKNPLTWKSIPVLSEPIPVRVEYPQDAPPCPRNEPEPIKDAR